MSKRKQSGKQKVGRIRSAKGGGSLQLRGTTFLACWTGADGKRHAKSTGETDEASARARLAQFIEDDRKANERALLQTERQKILDALDNLKNVDNRLAEIRKRENAIPLDRVFDEYTASPLRHNSEETTHRRHRIIIGRFIKWARVNCSDVATMDEVDDVIAQKYAAEIGTKYEAATFNQHIAILRLAWKCLRVRGGLSHNPWGEIPKKQVTNHSKRNLELAEMVRVVNSAEGEMRLLILLGMHTGQRLEDCVLWSWDDPVYSSVNLDASVISVVPRKTARRRGYKPLVFPLEGELRAAVLAYAAPSRTGYLMPSLAARYKQDDGNFVRKVQKHFTDCGIEIHATEKSKSGRAIVEVGFHSLRHSFVSLSANAKVPLAFVQQAVGHGSPAMTRHYYHADESVMKTVVSAIPEMINRTAKQIAENERSERMAKFKSLVDEMIKHGDDISEARRYLDVIDV